MRGGARDHAGLRGVQVVTCGLARQRRAIVIFPTEPGRNRAAWSSETRVGANALRVVASYSTKMRLSLTM